MNNFYIITGGPGSGKTTILNELKNKGYLCVDEVARQIIQEQNSVSGDAVHGKNQIKFLDLMFRRSIDTFKQVQEANMPVFFDRGIPELIGYCHLIKADIPDELLQAVQTYRYNQRVYIMPPWREIYQTDTERMQTWEEAVETYRLIASAYQEAGYLLVEVPKVSTAERIKFIEIDIQGTDNATITSI